MKSKNLFQQVLVTLILLWGFTINAQSYEKLPQKWTYGVEINDVLCGFAESVLYDSTYNGHKLLCIDEKVKVKQSVLGGEVDMYINSMVILDATNKYPITIKRALETTAEMYSFSKYEKGQILHTNSRDQEPLPIEMEEGLIVENSLDYPHLKRDFLDERLEEKSYRVYDDMRGIIATKIYKRIGEEKIKLAGKEYDVVKLEEFNKNLGTISYIWFDKQNFFPLRTHISNRKIYLADESIKKRIQVVDLDNVLFAKVNKVITNVPDISYMKVAAKINTTGELVTAEHLNFPGQSFEGSVVENYVEGVFELQPVLYQGQNAPTFPSDQIFDIPEKYLKPESLIESDHPELIEEARKITDGCGDSWEATVRLSKWVAENIRGAVPGGTSAINTYHTREGECGSHSRLLAAFCRAVGIPSRLSIGCMYSPYLGGSFGQHAWTEVYMGENGWVPIDATAFEYDYVDAGHIRLGEGASFNPESMEILEYKMKGGEESIGVDIGKYESYLGDYVIEGTDRTFKVVFEGGSLGVDIPRQGVLALNDADEKGIFHPKMTRQINFSFNQDEEGIIKSMKLQQLVVLQKKKNDGESAEDIPEKYLEFVGKYSLSQPPADFEVFVQDNILKVNDPLSNSVVGLKKKDKTTWIDEYDKNEMVFDRNPAGVVVGMTIYINVILNKS